MRFGLYTVTRFVKLYVKAIESTAGLCMSWNYEGAPFRIDPNNRGGGAVMPRWPVWFGYLITDAIGARWSLVNCCGKI